jgi:CO/xanthine dehydrogenase Mo-binding subunit
MGAKSQGECAINPVAPAISNALADATGVRFSSLPFTPDRIYARLPEEPRVVSRESADLQGAQLR